MAKRRKKVDYDILVTSDIDPSITLAIEIKGGMRALGRAIGTTHQNIRGWKRVPPTRVIAIEEITGIPREVIRPDIYPPKKKKDHVA
jgi:DNA-binding transcriptional regulator YdaS (Cro superfamily)